MYYIQNTLTRSLALAAEFGDHDDEKHTPDFLSDYVFLPPVSHTHFYNILIKFGFGTFLLFIYTNMCGFSNFVGIFAEKKYKYVCWLWFKALPQT